MTRRPQRAKPRRHRRRALPAILVLVAVLSALPTSATRAAASRQAESGPPTWLADAPVDTAGLGSGPYSTMEMLYERTLFNVDVMRLTLIFGPETAVEIERVAEGVDHDDARLADRVAGIALEASDVLVRSHFLRDVSLEQFLDGLQKSMAHAFEADILTAREYRTLLPTIREQYRPLSDRGIHDGETMWYRVRGDSLHVVFEAEDGGHPVDVHVQGSERRRSVLGGYFAPDSDFREGLIRSLFGESHD